MQELNYTLNSSNYFIKGLINKKNQVFELNSSSIEEIGIFEDQIDFFSSQLFGVRGKIEENWQFNDQLRVKLHKSETKYHNKKGEQG